MNTADSRVVATAGHRTAAERERDYSESGPGTVWSLEARQSGPSPASDRDRRLLEAGLALG